MRESFEQWWRKPTLHQHDSEAKRVTYLELFFDLVFVVVISRLAHRLTAHSGWIDFAEFAVLFVPVWWVWSGITYYNERFETFDISFRVFTFLQMLAVAGMAAFVDHGLTSVAFAVSYAFARGLTTFMWWRAGRHNPALRPITDAFTLGFSIGVALWLASTLLSGPASAALKVLGTTIELVTPVFTLRSQRLLFTAPLRKLPERYALFVIIVLGESLVGVVNGLAAAPDVGIFVLSRSALGLLLGFGMWWIYFDFIGRREPQAHTKRQFAWIYLHVPLLMSITLVGAMLARAVSPELEGAMHEADVANSRWLLALGFALYYLSVAAQEFVVEHERLVDTRFITIVRIMTALVALTLPLLPVSLAAIVGLLVVLHAIHAGIGMRAWFRTEHAGRKDVH